MENNLQRFSPFYQPPFYMVSPHTQGPNLVTTQTGLTYDPCCMQAGFVPYPHSYTGRGMDYNSYVYHHTTPCVEMQSPFASFEGKLDLISKYAGVRKKSF